MIPKILHFIWIGEPTKFPKYGNYAMDAFAKMNPGFEIKFTQYSKQQIIDLVSNKDEDIMQLLSDSCDQIVRNFTNVKKNIKSKFMYWDFFKNVNTVVSNNVRPYLIGKYGGIYLDLDCYPIKPFDEKILNVDKFCVQSQYMSNGKFGNDWYCIGGDKGQMNKFNDIFVNSQMLELNPLRINDNITYAEYRNMQEKFKNLVFSKSDVREQDKNGYFYHFAVAEKFK